MSVQPDYLDAALTQDAHVLLRGRAVPHARVHSRRHNERARMRQRALGDEVVGDPARQLRERVGGGRCDHVEIGALEVRVGALLTRAPRKSVQRLRGHEPLPGLGQKRNHLVPVLDEQAHEFARLVGGNATTNTN